MEWPLAILALTVVPALILEDRTTNPALRSLFNAVNWFVWLAFVAEFCLGFAVARSGCTFLRTVGDGFKQPVAAAVAGSAEQ